MGTPRGVGHRHADENDSHSYSHLAGLTRAYIYESLYSDGSEMVRDFLIGV